MAQVAVFEARLENEPGVTRTLAVRSDETLAALHRLIQKAFDWQDDHLYSFWLDGGFWGARESEYTVPIELEEGAQSSEVALDVLALEPGQRIAYIFDYGDEWRVSLKLREIREEGEVGILECKGEAPPQYPDYADD